MGNAYERDRDAAMAEDDDENRRDIARERAADERTEPDLEPCSPTAPVAVKDLAAFVVQSAAAGGPPGTRAAAFRMGCAHRDKQVIAYLHKMAAEWDANGAHNMGNAVRSYAADIERGEHVK